jgi:hypothetical protein
MKRGWQIFLLVVLTLVFFSPILIPGEGFLYGDNFSQRIPTLTFWKQEIGKGRMPLWNPYILGGIPFFADLSNNAIAPTNLLYLFLPVPLALSFLAIFFILLAAIFTYRYVKILTKTEIASLFSAITFAFSGTLIAGINDINSLQGIAFIPVVLFAAHQWIIKQSFKKALCLIAVLSLQFVSSHPQYSYYTWLAIAFYLLYFLKGSLKKRLLLLLSTFAIFFLISAIQLLPFLEFSKLAYRPQTAEFSAQNQLKLIEIPRLVFANFYGSWKAGSSWGPGSQLETGLANTEGYIGLLPLILALYIALTGKGKQVKFWRAVAGLTFLLSLGSQTPLFALLRAALPFYSKFRSPIRILSFYSFAMAVLAGISLKRFEKEKRS